MVAAWLFQRTTPGMAPATAVQTLPESKLEVKRDQKFYYLPTSDLYWDLVNLTQVPVSQDSVSVSSSMISPSTFVSGRRQDTRTPQELHRRTTSRQVRMPCCNETEGKLVE